METHICDFCERTVSFITEHHLIPKATHNNKLIKKRHTQEELFKVAWACKDCHRTIHALFSEKTLARQFNSVDDLKGDIEMGKYLAWIKNKPEGAASKARQSKSKR